MLDDPIPLGELASEILADTFSAPRRLPSTNVRKFAGHLRALGGMLFPQPDRIDGPARVRVRLERRARHLVAQVRVGQAVGRLLLPADLDVEFVWLRLGAPRWHHEPDATGDADGECSRPE